MSKSKIKRKTHFHVKIPFCHAQTNPAASMKRKTISERNAPAPNPVNATANGRRKSSPRRRSER